MAKNKRMTRINEEIEREMANIIRFEMADPRLGTVVSVIDADTTADLKYCKVAVSVMGSEEEQQVAMKALKGAEGFFRKKIAEKINLRYTPEITIILDESIEYGFRMGKLIDSVNT
jgi:ribosome-binding factor A